jgi:hypothetical protein
VLATKRNPTRIGFLSLGSAVKAPVWGERRWTAALSSNPHCRLEFRRGFGHSDQHREEGEDGDKHHLNAERQHEQVDIGIDDRGDLNGSPDGGATYVHLLDGDIGEPLMIRYDGSRGDAGAFGDTSPGIAA